MRRALLACLLAAGCAPAAEEPAPDARQLEIAAAHAREDASIDSDPCFGRVEDPRSGARIMVSYPPGDCGEVGRAEVISGIWYRGFEEMRFAENATSAPARRVFRRRDFRAQHVVELWITRAEQERVADDDPRLGTRAILIRFVGRKSRARPSGDRGATYQTVAVDRLLTARTIEVIDDYIDCRDLPPREHGTPCAPGTGPGVR